MLTLLAVGGEAATFGAGLFHNDLDQVHDRSETEADCQVRQERTEQDEDTDPSSFLMPGQACAFAPLLLARLNGAVRPMHAMGRGPSLRLHRLLGVSLN